MKILMINPSSAAIESPREYILGIPYLVSVLRANGHSEIQVLNHFNTPWETSRQLIVNTLEDFKPEVMIISSFTINRIAGCKTAVLTKEYNPETKIVMGGFHPSFMYQQILSNYPVDAVCIGEGENTIVELLDAYRSNTAIDAIKGIAYRKNGKVIKTGQRPFIKDLDQIPFPAHDVYKDYLLKTKKGHIISSRGCPFGCQFCSTTEFWGRNWRARSSENVVDEIEMLVRDYGVNYINFMDDAFTLNKNRAIEISKEILNRGLKIDWICSTRASSIDRELLDWMTKAGCKHIALGLESGSTKVLKSTGKKITVEQVINAFGLLEEYGLSRGVFLMVGNPGEDRTTVKETIQLVKKIKLDVASVAVTEIYPGTQLYELAKSKGFLTDEHWLTENPPPFYTIEHSAEKLQWWAFLIVLASKKLQGPIKLIGFILWYISSKQKKIMRYLARVIQKPFAGGKQNYSYKEY